MDNKFKKCIQCGENKPISQFYTNGKDKNGNTKYRPECKDCHKIRQKKNFNIEKLIRKRAQGILKRVNNTNRVKNKSYKNIECEIGDTIEEIYQFLLQYKDDFEKIIQQNSIPSVDRINSNKNYTKDNIQIITLEENTKDGLVKAQKATSKPLLVVFKDGNKRKYKSVSSCSRELNIKRDTIIRHRDNKTICKFGIKFIDLS